MWSKYHSTELLWAHRKADPGNFFLCALLLSPFSFSVLSAYYNNFYHFNAFIVIHNHHTFSLTKYHTLRVQDSLGENYDVVSSENHLLRNFGVVIAIGLTFQCMYMIIASMKSSMASKITPKS